MRIDKNFGREILVDLVSGVTNRKPLEMEIDCPPTILVRMPHGNFSVRVLTPAPAEIQVELDNVVVVKRNLDKGTHTLAQTESGAPLFFAEPGSKDPRALAMAQAAVNEMPKREDSTATEPAAQSPQRIVAPSQGLVVVSIRLSDATAPNSPPLPPDDVTSIFFQLNPPGQHEAEVAGLLSKVVAPADVDFAEILDDGQSKRPMPKIVRHCNCKH